MLKGLLREITLAIQTRSGASPSVFVWIAVAAFASLFAFVFLCVAAYDGLRAVFGPPFAGLIMAGCFVLVGVIAAIGSVVTRRRVRERAILERASRAHASSWLLDPRVLTAVVQAGRTLGWQRIVPVALLGFLATQWAREYRDQRKGNAG
jgi:hypothetical protein